MFCANEGCLLNIAYEYQTRSEENSFLGGTPQNFGVLCPPKECFIALLVRIFENFQNLEFYLRHFFSKNSPEFPNFSWNFLIFFKSEKKTIIFVTKFVQIDYIDQNLAKFSHKTPKDGHFLLKPSIFQIFGAFGAENLEFYVPKTRFLWS